MIFADMTNPPTEWLQYPAIGLLAAVLWWLGKVIRDALKDHKAIVQHMATENRETITNIMERHDAESVRRDERCDKAHEVRDKIMYGLKAAIETLADEIRGRKT